MISASFILSILMSTSPRSNPELVLLDSATQRLRQQGVSIPHGLCIAISKKRRAPASCTLIGSDIALPVNRASATIYLPHSLLHTTPWNQLTETVADCLLFLVTRTM